MALLTSTLTLECKGDLKTDYKKWSAVGEIGEGFWNVLHNFLSY